MNIIIKLIVIALFFLLEQENVFSQPQADSAAIKTGDLTLHPSLSDTSINKNKISNHTFVDAYRHDKEFGYMKYLDSVLRHTNNLTVDTYSVFKNPGYNKKEGSQRSTTADKKPMRINIVNSPVVKILLWIAAVFVIGLIIWKIFLSEQFFKKESSYKNTGTQKEEEILPDAAAYQSLILKAVKDKNYRLAIRYSYLQTLQLLAGKGLIQFSADKTNYQYVTELKNTTFQNDFAAITLHYEYVWYGKFEINEQVYHKLSEEYTTFNNKI